jgi:starvation-inducible DNA-binding protein
MVSLSLNGEAKAMSIDTRSHDPTRGDSKRGATINIGISADDRSAIAAGLSALLADTYTLYLTTHNFHWNVTGQMFNTLHMMFMTQYTELWNAVDPIAERIRSLGHTAPGSYAQFSSLASIPDAPTSPPKALDMVRILVTGHEAVARTARGLFPLADKAGDEPTADLLTRRWIAFFPWRNRRMPILRWESVGGWEGRC